MGKELKRDICYGPKTGLSPFESKGWTDFYICYQPCNGALLTYPGSQFGPCFRPLFAIFGSPLDDLGTSGPLPPLGVAGTKWNCLQGLLTVRKATFAISPYHFHLTTRPHLCYTSLMLTSDALLSRGLAVTVTVGLGAEWNDLDTGYVGVESGQARGYAEDSADQNGKGQRTGELV